jgi:hypothetical protein
MADGVGPMYGSGFRPGDENFNGFLPVEHLRPQIDPPGLWSGLTTDGTVASEYLELQRGSSEWQYLARPDDPIACKNGHYRHLMSLASGNEEGQVLLNPLVRQPDGEWEAWDYSYKHPGSYRFRSFQAWLEHRCDQIEAQYGPAPDSTRQELDQAWDSPGGAGIERPETAAELSALVDEFLIAPDWRKAIDIGQAARTTGPEAIPQLGLCIEGELRRDLYNVHTFVGALAAIGGRDARDMARRFFPNVMTHELSVTHAQVSLVDALASFDDELSSAVVLSFCDDVDHPPAALVARLGRFKQVETVDKLAQMIERPTGDDPARRQAEALLALEDLATEEARGLLAHLDHLEAWRCLARLGDPNAYEPLLELSDSNDPTSRRSALDGLRDLNDPRSIVKMRHVINNSPPESDETAIAAHTLAVLQPEDVEQRLTHIRQRTTNPDVHAVIDEWLPQLTVN